MVYLSLASLWTAVLRKGMYGTVSRFFHCENSARLRFGLFHECITEMMPAMWKKVGEHHTCASRHLRRRWDPSFVRSL